MKKKQRSKLNVNDLENVMEGDANEEVGATEKKQTITLDPILNMQPIKSDKLPKQYKQLIQTVGIGEPMKEQGEFFKTFENMSLKNKFKGEMKNKLDQVITSLQLK